MRKKEGRVVDNGSFYTFPAEPAYTTVKPGIYYPGWDSNLGFLLIQNKVKKENLEQQINALTENFSHLDFGSSAEVVTETGSKKDLQQTLDRLFSKYRESNPSVEEELNSEFVSSEYFPMEKYNPGLEKVDEGIKFFLEKKEFFTKNSLDYKRSILFFGPPGTGKTWYIRNVCERITESHDAITIRVDTYDHLECLHMGLNTVHRTLKDRMKIIVIEELAVVCEHRDTKTKALQLLDSTYFRDNVLFLVTTNEPETIPKNLIDRPSRLDVLAHVDGIENNESFVPDWYKHITGKTFPEKEKEQAWYKEAVKLLSPVYWLELFKFSELHQKSLEESWVDILNRKKLIENSFSTTKSVGF